MFKDIKAIARIFDHLSTAQVLAIEGRIYIDNVTLWVSEPLIAKFTGKQRAPRSFVGRNRNISATKGLKLKGSSHTETKIYLSLPELDSFMRTYNKTTAHSMMELVLF